MAFYLAEFNFKILINGVQEFFGIQIVFSRSDFVSEQANCQVLCHFATFNGLNTYFFQFFAKTNQFLIAIEFAPKCETPGPGENGSNWIGGSGFACLMIPIVTCNGSMSSFCLHNLPIRRDEHGRHETQ